MLVTLWWLSYYYVGHGKLGVLGVRNNAMMA
jgi:hypothetical protein